MNKHIIKKMSKHSVKKMIGQQGLSMMLVIFIILALSLLAAAMVQLLTANQDSVVREVLSSRALLAAESGAQRLLADIHTLGQSQCVDKTYTFVALQGCETVSIRCSVVSHASDVFYTIESAGVCGPAGEQASRTVTVQAKNI